MKLLSYLVPLLGATRAAAQASVAAVGTVDSATAAVTSSLLQQGVLGVFCVIFLAAIWFLYRELRVSNQRFTELAIQQGSLLTEVNAVLNRNEVLLERALDRAALPRAQALDVSRQADVVGVYRGGR